MTDNIAFDAGGGLFGDHEGVIMISNSNVSANTAFAYGRGVAVVSKSSLTISSGTFEGNITTGAGGAVFTGVERAVNISEAQFLGNKAGESLPSLEVPGEIVEGEGGGGALFLGGSGPIHVTDIVVEGNRAGSEGGGIFIENAGMRTTLTRMTIHDNKATLDGGGIEGNGSGDFTLIDNMIYNNTSENGGGFPTRPTARRAWSAPRFGTTALSWAQATTRGWAAACTVWGMRMLPMKTLRLPVTLRRYAEVACTSTPTTESVLPTATTVPPTAGVSCTATTVTLPASADAWVDQGSASSNKGTDSILKVMAKSGNTLRALVQFNLPAVPQGCVIESATLRLHAASWKNGWTLRALQVNAAWTENGVTWNNQPATTGTAATTSSGSGWREWNVAAMVQAMYESGLHYGFLIRDAAENSDAEQQFHGREKGENIPQPLINFGPAP